MNSVTFKHYEQIGKVKFLRTKASRSLKITVKSPGEVLVSHPLFVSHKKAESYLLSKMDWITANQKRQTDIQQFSIFDEQSVFTTKKHRLLIDRVPSDKLNARIYGGKIHIKIPEHINIHQSTTQEFIRKVITETLRIEAKSYLPPRTLELAAHFGFDVNKVFVKNNISNWGSCSNKNNINLNLHLMRLPDSLCDYVILHELCHTVHRNHGNGFWELLNSVTNQHAKLLAGQMKNYSPKIF